VTTIAPFPTESAGITQNEKIPAGSTEGHEAGHIYAGAVGFSAGVWASDLGGLGVEEPINYYPVVDTLRRARRIAEQDFPVGGPFGA
jgi:hypothetical protein